MFDRIVSDPRILGGKPVIRGTRISVEMILEWLASGSTRDELVRKHAQLVAADVEEAINYAAAMGVTLPVGPSNGLAKFAGGWSEDELREFNAAMAPTERVDQEMWQDLDHDPTVD